MKRTTITLTDRDQQALSIFTNPDTAEYSALVRSASKLGIAVEPDSSEATFIRALLQAGAAALQENALEQGYAELAAVWDDAEVHDQAEARERRRRNERRRSAVSA